MLEFTLSSRRAKGLIVDGFIFQKFRTNFSKNQEVNSIYWKCSKYRFLIYNLKMIKNMTKFNSGEVLQQLAVTAVIF